MLFGDQHSGNAQIVESARSTWSLSGLSRSAHSRTWSERAGIGKTPRNRVAQHLLVLRKSEIHQFAPCF